MRNEESAIPRTQTFTSTWVDTGEKGRPDGDIHSMAEAHWAYTEKMMHQAYVEAFVHGWKHGREETKS